MNTKNVLKTAAAIVLLAFVAGCAKAPQEKIDSAKMAVSTAQTAEAERYATDQFNAAKDSLDAAMAEVQAQDSKFALTRSYKHAEALLEAATTTANAAAEAAAKNKEMVRAEAEELLSKMQSTLEENKALVKTAPRGKEGRAALELIQKDISTLEASLPEITNSLNSGDFLTARDKAKAGLEKADAISEELQMAAAKKKALATKARAN